MKALAGVLRARLPHVLVLATAILCAEYLRISPVVFALPAQILLGDAFELFVNGFLMAFTIVAIISACELGVSPGWRRTVVQVTALSLGSALYAYAIGTSPWLTVQYRAMGMEEGPALFMYLTWIGWAEAALLSAFYRAHEKADTASSALRRAELERERAQQGLFRSRLQVLEAQVEPQALSDDLLHVQRLYGENPDLADQALDDLIARLRAAMLASCRDGTVLRQEEAHG